MTIQFNKVTWYSKLAAVIVLIATILFAIYAYGEYKKISAMNIPDVSPPASENVSLVVGKSATLSGLEITLNSIVQDSRCPADVNCFWAGNVTAHVTLRSLGKTEEVDLLSDGMPYKFGPYSIFIGRVDPIRGKEVKINQKDYTVVFNIAGNFAF